MSHAACADVSDYKVSRANGSTSAARLAHGVSDESLRHFDTAFSEISSKFHIVIVAEGVPLQQTLDDGELRRLQKKLGGRRSGPAAAVLADAFDYDCEAGKGNIYLLRKRYSDPNDLPFVTYDEILHSLTLIFAVIEPGLPSQFVMGKDSIFWKLYDSLSADQRNLAQRRRRRVLIA